MAFALSLSLSLAACGGGDDGSDETEAWARQVCNEMRPHVKRIQSANAAITEASESDAAPKELQQADSTAFQDVSEAYTALAETVQRAGDPPVEDGPRLRRNAVTELNDISDSYTDLKDTIDGLETSDRAAFAEGLGGIAERLGQLSESSDRALHDLQEGELGEAMAQQPGCQSLSATAQPDAGSSPAEE
ncbi:small secreted protein [Streptomyces sp. 6N223]|uniref:small secreted protein n=1 Tax=Streptomyces sp. 6N223 TaxID=3457412 RepID=UPI003FD461A7